MARTTIFSTRAWTNSPGGRGDDGADVGVAGGGGEGGGDSYDGARAGAADRDAGARHEGAG